MYKITYSINWTFTVTLLPENPRSLLRDRHTKVVRDSSTTLLPPLLGGLEAYSTMARKYLFLSDNKYAVTLY